MADTKVFSFPENGNTNNIPFSIPIGGNGFGFGNGMNGIVDLFGLAIIASIFGWGNGGFGGWGGNAGGAGFLSNQLNNDSGRELIMNAITSQGVASRHPGHRYHVGPRLQSCQQRSSQRAERTPDPCLAASGERSPNHQLHPSR